ncbi:hypothetical protein [Microbacterium ulmi]|uniref:Lipoprotein n=1 Tax=Microbacterium ulmi TaxID=179095 RepID=A0A7Y2M0B2_9MICO|nr:hypothetical protein [Microbacterium ulmi]NII70604.1 methionine synthase II (cobalamin-independent) [Microbacterium ulmi]NNH04155.1 hypothetical protein [Microbacterium ulmi]
MKLRIAAWTLAAVAVLGLTACSAGPESTGETPAASAPAAPAETTASEQTVAEACVSMAGPLEEASTTLAKLADAAADPQAAVDAWTALVDAYQEVADTVTNAEVKAAATTAKDDLAAVRDAIAKIYVDGDTAALSDLTTATTDMQTSLTALSTLCAG